MGIEQLYLADILTSFSGSNLSGQVIVFVLAAGSVMAWSIMITKFRALAEASRQSEDFLRSYRKEDHPLALFLRRSKYDSSPDFQVYTHACTTLGAVLEARGVDSDDLFMGGVGMELPQLSNQQLSHIRNVADRTMADEVLLLEDSMGLLATAVSAAPFLGLLGTVWGVMDAFGNMGSGGSVMISQVGPGISGALVTTVVGLLVALPSLMGYNLLSNTIRKMTVHMDNFVQEFGADLEGYFSADS